VDGLRFAIPQEFDAIPGWDSVISRRTVERMDLYNVLAPFVESTRNVPSGPIHLPNHWSVTLFAGGAGADVDGGLLDDDSGR
jgi:hypothetical protein